MGIFKRDTKGIAELMKAPDTAAAVHALAEEIATDVRGQHPDADVVVDDYVTDRAASSVTIRDPRAKGWQARDGVLTRAAGTVGLEVTER